MDGNWEDSERVIRDHLRRVNSAARRSAARTCDDTVEHVAFGWVTVSCGLMSELKPVVESDGRAACRSSALYVEVAGDGDISRDASHYVEQCG